MSRAPTGHEREPFPTNIPDFLDYLDRLYPEPSVKPSQTIEQVMFEAGQREVVKSARAHFEQSMSRPDAPIR